MHAGINRYSIKAHRSPYNTRSRSRHRQTDNSQKQILDKPQGINAKTQHSDTNAAHAQADIQHKHYRKGNVTHNNINTTIQEIHLHDTPIWQGIDLGLIHLFQNFKMDPNQDNPANPQNPNPNALKASDFLPSRFFGNPGDSPQPHILTYEDYIQQHDIQGDQPRINRFKLTLGGKARQWLDSENFNTFQELKDAFIAYFSGSHTRMAAVQNFMNCNYIPGETLKSYAMRLRELGTRCQYGDNTIYYRFINGLPLPLKKVLASEEGENLDAIIRKGQRMLDIDPAMLSADGAHKEVAFSAVTNTSNEELSAQVALLTQQMKDMTTSHKDNGQNRAGNNHNSNNHNNGYRGRNNNNRNNNRRFNNNNRYGRNNNRQNNGQGGNNGNYNGYNNRGNNRPRSNKRNIICNFCRKPGHVWRECFSYIKASTSGRQLNQGRQSPFTPGMVATNYHSMPPQQQAWPWAGQATYTPTGYQGQPGPATPQQPAQQVAKQPQTNPNQPF